MNIKGMKYPLRNAAGDDASGQGAAPAGAEHQDAHAADAGAGAHEVPQDTLDEAKRMGWTPKDEFKGDPAKWRPADEFVERGKNMLPIVQDKVKRQEKQIAELQRTVKDFADHMSATERRGYERAKAELKAARADAVAKGDGATFEKAEEALEKLDQDAAAKASKNAQPADDPVYKDWEGRNSWLSDPKMSAFAESAGAYLRKTGETAQGIEFLDMVTKEVKARFPDKFANARREAPAVVESGAPAQRRGGKSFADMPADARAACERMAKNGFGSDPKAMAEFKAQFVKTHFEEA